VRDYSLRVTSAETTIPYRCSLRSEEAGEELAGTASAIRRWLLVEHAGPWGKDALRDARMPSELSAALRSMEGRTGARVLLIRRPDHRPRTSFACFAVDTLEAWLGETTLERIDDASALDPSVRESFRKISGSLAIVCTHGRRDPCCAERGRPLAASAASSGLAWESTHVGGDRFAGNLVLFPHGLFFGRVEPERAAEVIDAYGEGRIVLDLFRGRSSRAMPVQAAEHALRTAFALDGVDDAVPERIDQETGDVLGATFATSAGRYLVRVRRTSGIPMRPTCHSLLEETPPTWRVITIDAAA
jgi:hypothetical protein